MSDGIRGELKMSGRDLKFCHPFLSVHCPLANEPVLLQVPSEALGKNKKYDSVLNFKYGQEGMRVSPDVKSFKKIQKHVIGGGPLENAVCSCLLIVFPKDSGPSSTEQVMYVRAVNGSQYRVCSVLKGRSFKKFSQKSITGGLSPDC